MRFAKTACLILLAAAGASAQFTAGSGSPFALGATPTAVAAGDFNNNGKLDLVTANAGNNSTVLLGDGTGGFNADTGSPFAVGANPASVAVGDFNGDGNLDFVIINSGDNTITVLLGTGSGGFTPASGSPFTVGTTPQSVAVADFNGDGKLDIVTANNGASSITVLLGNGTGGFTAASGSPVPAGLFPQSVAAGDFNGDSKLDLVEANSGDNTVRVLVGDGTGAFTGSGAYLVGSLPHSVAVADFNGDGKPDIVTANYGDNTLTVLLNNGSGGFTAAANSPFTVGSNPQSVAVADMNGDGKPDLVAANSGDNTVTVLLGNGSGGFNAAAGSPFAAGTIPISVAIGDFNGDGRPDIAIADIGGSTLTVLLGANAMSSSTLSTTAGSTITYGTSVPLTLVVTGGFGTPSGTATFLDGGMSLGTATQTSSPYLFDATDLAVGIHMLTASYGGDASAAPSASNTVSITVTQASQSIAFGALSNQPLAAAPFTVSATASSGLAVSFTSTTLPVCTLSGTTVTLVSAGTCTIQATQAGNTNYAAAPSVSQNFTVIPAASQTIAFGALSNQAFATAPFTVSATASSGLAVSFASTTLSVCTMSGAKVTLVSAGTCTIQASQPGNASYAAAAPVSQSFTVIPANQTITFGALSNQAFGSAPFTISATASSGLAVSFAPTTPSVCTVSATMVTLISAGTCTIQASQAGNANYAAATSVSQHFTVTSGSQTITFGALSNQALGTAPFTLGATASSGLAVSFTSTTLPVCTVSGATVTLVSVGTCTIQTSQPGNTNYSAATSVSQHFTVTPTPNQTITFGALADQPFGTAPFKVSATASSGLTVSFTSTTLPVCTVSGTTVTLVSAGTCTIQASQAGNATYSPAASVSQSFTVTPANQTITFAALTSKPFGSVPFTVSATSSSGLAVSFASTTMPVCTVAGATVTLVSAGTCTIQASQTGNANYAAATVVNQNFTVTPGNQTITFGTIPNQAYGTSPLALSATASSGLAVSFVSTTLPVCTVSGTMVTLVSAGTCTIQASQPGNTNYAPATSVTQHFTVTTASQTIAFGTLSNQPFGTAPFALSATASSGLTVVFTSTTLTICTVSSAAVTLVTGGKCTIQAAQAGNTNYAAATPVNQSFTVTPASQTITFDTLSNQALGTAPITVSATASSGLTVSFTSTTSSVCTVASATVKLVSVGSCTVQAAQAGNTNYAAAPMVSQSFTVTAESQTIAFGTLANKPFGIGVFTVSATASSGLAVSFASATPSVCSVTGATVTLLGQGTCTIQASQPGNTSTYAPATPVNQSFTVTQAVQTIAFGALTSKALGTVPFTLSATASSGLPVTFASNSGVCTISGTTVTLMLAGTCTIQASQGGNANYSAATPVDQSFTVTPDSQTITFGALKTQPLGTAPFTVSASASSGLPVSFTSTTPAVCTVSGTTVTLLTPGPCAIQASQPGNNNYAAAPLVSQTFTVGTGTLTIRSVLNAGSYAAVSIAADECTVAFGIDFSTTTASTTSLSLSRTLASATVTITDSNGMTVTAPLFYVSPTQINFLVPEGLALGSGTVTVANAAGKKVSFPITVAPVSPSLFTADSSGTGAPAAIALTDVPGQVAQATPVFNCSGSPSVCTATPISLGSSGTSVYLELFGTGIRGRTGLSNVLVTVGGLVQQVTYAGAQSSYAGLDQVNVLLDPSLAGSGQVTLQLTVDGMQANPVMLNIQ